MATKALTTSEEILDHILREGGCDHISCKGLKHLISTGSYINTHRCPLVKQFNDWPEFRCMSNNFSSRFSERPPKDSVIKCATELKQAMEKLKWIDGLKD